MTRHLLDSSAWIECLVDGPNTRHFAPILRKLPDLIVPTITILEVRRVVLRQRSISEADSVTRGMQTGEVIDLDAILAIEAADLASKHRLPLADSIIYATALSHEAALWTQDEDFEGLPNVRYFPKMKAST
jgi:predicted nucleic acid-binding protein